MAVTPQERPDIQVFSEMGQIDQLVRLSISRRLPPGMAYAQFELLRIIAREGDGQTPAELARALMLTKGALTNILQRMQAAGFVTVEDDAADRRKKRVRATVAGMVAYTAVVKRLQGQNRELRSAFTDDEFLAVLPFLKALRAFLAEVTGPDALSAAPR